MNIIKIPDHLYNKIQIYEEYYVKLYKSDIIKKHVKYYLMNLYKHNTINTYFVLVTYGIIGYKTKDEFLPFFDKEKAINYFIDCYKKKTGNNWGEEFIRNKDKYILYTNLNIKHEDNRIERFISYIFNNCQKFIYYCGHLNKSLEILNTINNNDLSIEQLTYLSNSYFEIIPQIQKQKRDNIELITKSNISRYYEELESFRINKNIFNIISVSNNIIDNIPHKLSILNNDNTDYPVIIKYINSSLCDINNIIKLDSFINSDSILDSNINSNSILELNNKHKIINNLPKEYPYNLLLFHGTKSCNLLSILFEGLMKSGKTSLMYGDGIYFADNINKSKAYSDGYILICKVKINNLIEHVKANHSLDKFINNPTDIVKGIGNCAPKSYIKFNDMYIPNDYTHITNNNILGYNEYVVYDPSLIEIKYIIEIRK